MINISQHEECSDCLGSGLQVQDSGVMKGTIRMCPKCSKDYDTYTNNYGTDEADTPIVYIDEGKGIVEKIDRKKDYLLLPNGEEIDLSEDKKYYN